MKKISIALLLVVVLCGLLLIRTLSSFPDRQLQNVEPIAMLEVDSMAMAQRLAGAIRIPTISHDDRNNFDAGAFRAFHAYLAENFPLTHAHATVQTINQYSLVYHIPGQQAALKPALFMGHMDVVPVDAATAEQWQHPPFAGAIVNGVVWGRGALDDKLTVLALLEATEMLLANGEQPQRTVYLAFGHDEEVGGNDGAAQIAAHFAQQDIEFEFVLDEGGAVTEGLLPGVDSAVAIIGIAEKGYVNLHLSVKAPGGHSSQPPPHTAAGILAAAIVKLEARPFPADLSAMDANFNYLGHYLPLFNRLALANQWLFAPLIKSKLLADPASAASIRTTTAVTMLEGSSKSNILPTRASAVANLRILPGDTVASVTQHIKNAIDDERVEISAHMANEPSPVSSTDSFGFRLLEKTIRSMDNTLLVAPYLVQGGTDAKHFVNLSDNVYRFMMTRVNRSTMTRIHGVNEQVSIDDYVAAVRFYYALLTTLADPDTQPAELL